MRNVSLALALVCITCSIGTAEPSPASLSLEGQWRFQMDPDDEGESQEWFAGPLAETVRLPGTMDENGKGIPNSQRNVTAHLSRERTYVGRAWYQRDIEIPDSWAGKRITLHLERTRFTSVWLDGKFLGHGESLGCEQVFEFVEKTPPGAHVLTIAVDNRMKEGIRGGHMVTDHTQVNWNGIVGDIVLRATDPVWIDAVLAYPLVNERAARIQLTLGNSTEDIQMAEVQISAECPERAHTTDVQVETVALKEGQQTVEIIHLLGDRAVFWDEFSPNLYEITVRLAAGPYSDVTTIPFGLREFGTEGTQFVINGRKTFLRGKHDALVWPLTGYASMDVSDWVRVLRIAKSYGINHYRFHSCTPPKAAFTAADRVGIYMQPELYNFGGDLSASPRGIRYAKEEGRRILEAYGNHPSFVMMTLGNEMHQGRKTRAEVIRGLRAFDPSRLYAQASNYDFGELRLEQEDDYWTTVRTAPDAAHAIRGSFSHADLPLGHIQSSPPSTNYDYTHAIRDTPVPVIGHETGQFQVSPNFDEIKKYTGVQKAWNLEVFQERLKDAGLYDQWRDFFRASGALAVLCYREEIEAALRTPGFGGFQLLDLQDFPGQGTALVGILDAFMDSKGLIAPEEWRAFCAETVLLARMEQYTWVAGERFEAKIQVANYGPAPLSDKQVVAELTGSDGRVLETGVLNAGGRPIGQGSVTEVGKLEWAIPRLEQAEKLTLHLRIEGTDVRNAYPLWVYPVDSPSPAPAGVHISRKLDADVILRLEQGERVLFFPELDSLPNSIEGFFASDFWCFPMFRSIAKHKGNKVAPGTLGLLCDPEHPALAAFPTEFHSNWQWWHLVMNSRAIILDDTPKKLRPIVQVIDNFERNHKLGLVFECNVGPGRLVVCSIDLLKLLDRPEAKQLYESLLSYMDSAEFTPSTALAPGLLARMLTDSGAEDDSGGAEELDFNQFFDANE